ncbi:MAG: tRNA pseudouridine(54/55) synthase Pus10 [Candidatus Bathyarchaeota archaeon]|nr:MAG: tRNA pseudouridine(54/55) synthase Pus10 [Candidatus Bathyarchaeota archaeon]
MSILEKALNMLTTHPLCDDCLGRQFALLGHGVENRKRGETIKLLLTMEANDTLLRNDEAGEDILRKIAGHGSFEMAHKILTRFGRKAPSKRRCYLCEGKCKSVIGLAKKAVGETKNHEFSTFLVGIELPLEIAEREDEFKARFEVSSGESIKSQMSRVIGKKIERTTGKSVDFKKPDVALIINPFTSDFKLQINPLYISGRYRKLVRGIPQSRWLCRECDGRGCGSCNWTGKRFQESVEELIGKPIQKTLDGEEIAFHGAGREDVDVRMLGSGRPFVLEVKRPRKRWIDLEKLERTINRVAKGKVAVSELRFADKDLVRQLKKAESAEKSYRVLIEFERDVANEELKKVEEILSHTIIHQQTPKRVLHRRADLIREKYIYKAEVKKVSPNYAEMQIHCQGGLYIKELVTGDEGRTHPSVSEILTMNAKPMELDVLKVIAGVN